MPGSRSWIRRLSIIWLEIMDESGSVVVKVG
jgi:hypothetical protein